MFNKYLTIKNALTLFIILIFLQSLVFDFSDSFKNIFIFSQLGNLFNSDWLSLYGAYVIGVIELVAVLLLMSRFHIIGAIIAIIITSGMILFHLATPLGVALPIFNADGRIIADDSGRLFIMTCLAWLSSLVLIIQDMRTPAEE